MAAPERIFVDAPAVRERVPLLVGLVGPSGSGKTFSALRLATGVQKVDGGEVFFIDTEARRALHYAQLFKFRHVEFNAPFGPLDYLVAIDHCVAQGAKVIVVDSMSHEHEGPGGVLEMHEQETARLVQQWRSTPDKVKFSAWIRPKAERRRLLNSIVQRNVHFIFCFRAKEKLKILPGKDPIHLGWQAIAGDEFIYEMTMALYLPPGGKGKPDLAPQEIGEKALLKIPVQFREMVTNRELDEALGTALARWAEGDAAQGGAPGPDRQPRGQPEPTAATPGDQRQAILEQIARHLALHCTTKEQREGALQAAFGTFTKAGIGRLNDHELKAGADALKAQLEGLAALRGAGPPEREPGEE